MNSELHWDEFRDWCEDNGVGLEHREDWVFNWRCWLTALAAHGVEAAVTELESLGDE